MSFSCFSSVVGVRAAGFAAEHSPTTVENSVLVGKAIPLISYSTPTKE
jgi:hypothetical protein